MHVNEDDSPRDVARKGLQDDEHIGAVVDHRPNLALGNRKVRIASVETLSLDSVLLTTTDRLFGIAPNQDACDQKESNTCIYGQSYNII